MILPQPRPIDIGDLIPLAAQLENHDEFCPPPTDELAGLEATLYLESGSTLDVALEDATRLSWRADAASAWGSSGVASYEAAAAREGIYALTVARLEENVSALIVLDRPRRRVLVNLTSFAELEGSVREDTGILQAGIGGPLVEAFPRTTELVGKRLAHRYSTTHVFEHIYLNPNTYAFQGLAGPEAGVADVDAADYWKLGEQLYLLSWHERAQPFNGAVVIDLAAGRATGRLVGWDSATDETLQVRTGSIITELGTAAYDRI